MDTRFMSTAELQPASNRRIVVMGVAGCGKTTIGTALAERIGAEFHDGDRFHAEQSIRKMEAGTPLTDADRWPWLDRIGRFMTDHQGDLIIGCSALKRAYRDRLRSAGGEDILFLHLVGSKAVIAQRMRERPGHFMPPSLMDSQFDTLEPPGPDERAITLQIDHPVSELIDRAVALMGS